MMKARNALIEQRKRDNDQERKIAQMINFVLDD